MRTGGTLKTALGVLEIKSVEAIDKRAITDALAIRAGYASRQAALDELAKYKAGQLYKIELGALAPDPRIALRQKAELTEEEWRQIDQRLERYDRASRRGAWTRPYLRTIADRPGVRAPDLAAAAGVDTLWFKTQIRKLKELGLTESLKVGYRLSPRGRAYLEGVEKSR